MYWQVYQKRKNSKNNLTEFPKTWKFQKCAENFLKKLKTTNYSLEFLLKSKVFWNIFWQTFEKIENFKKPSNKFSQKLKIAEDILTGLKKNKISHKCTVKCFIKLEIFKLSWQIFQKPGNYEKCTDKTQKKFKKQSDWISKNLKISTNVLTISFKNWKLQKIYCFFYLKAKNYEIFCQTFEKIINSKNVQTNFPKNMKIAEKSTDRFLKNKNLTKIYCQIFLKNGDFKKLCWQISKKKQEITKNVLTSLSKNRKIQKTVWQNFQKLENFEWRADNL